MCCFSYLASKCKNFCLQIWHRRCKWLLHRQAQMASLQAICSRVTAAHICWGQPHACLSLDNEEKVWNVSYINWAIKDGGPLWPWPLTLGWKTKFFFLHIKRETAEMKGLQGLPHLRMTKSTNDAAALLNKALKEERWAFMWHLIGLYSNETFPGRFRCNFWDIFHSLDWTASKDFHRGSQGNQLILIFSTSRGIISM